MQILAAAFALALMAAVTVPTATTSYAGDKALSEAQIEGVQTAIRAMGCTVADSDIEAEDDGYEADDVVCEDNKKYDVYLDQDFKVTKKVEE